MTNSRSTFRRTESVTGSGLQAVHNIIAPLPGHLVNLVGYRMMCHSNALMGANGQFIAAALLLQTVDTNWSVSQNDIFNHNTLGRPPLANIIDQMLMFEQVFEQGTEGIGGALNQPKDVGWVPCDLLLPQIFAYIAADGSNTGNVIWYAQLEYRYKKSSVAEISAANLEWGRPPDRPQT